MHWLHRLRKELFSPDLWQFFRARCESWNGYDREAALRELPQLPAHLHGAALPLVLARLNDWVPEVRAAAAQALRPLLRDELEAAWIAALPQIVRLMAGKRWAQDGAGTRAAIEHFLLHAPQRRAALLACAPGMALPVQRWLAVQSWHNGPAEQRLAAASQALRGRDARLAWQALRHLQGLAADWPSLAAQAQFSALRLEALRKGLVPAAREAVALAFRPHAGTRNWVVFHADAELRLQLLRAAEDALASPAPWRRRLTALQLLRALQAPGLQAHIDAASADPQARMRELAYAIGLGLPGADGAALTCRALADPSPRLQRAALAALRSGRASLTVAELLALVRSEPAALQPALQALALHDPWTRAPAVLALLAAPAVDEAAASEHLRVLHSALAHSLYVPTPVQVSTVQQAGAQLLQYRPTLTLPRSLQFAA